jgi:hypothetical protein
MAFFMEKLVVFSCPVGVLNFLFSGLELNAAAEKVVLGTDGLAFGVSFTP